MRLFCVLLLLLTTAVDSAAQNAFEIDYRFNNQPAVNYKGLVVLNKDSGFIRLSRYDSRQQENVIYDFELRNDGQLLATTIGNDTFMVFKAENVKTFYIPKSDDILFWFIKNSYTSGKFVPATVAAPYYYYPGPLNSFDPVEYIVRYDTIRLQPDTVVRSSYVIDSNLLSMEKPGIAEGSCLNYKPIREVNLTRNYLKQFFATHELPVNKPLTLKQLTLSRKFKKPTLYCIMAANLADSSIGESCKVDVYNTTTFFSSAATFLRLPYKQININDKNFTLAGVKKAIQSIKADKNDIIVFAYSGHGFSFQNDERYQFPQMALWKGDAPTRAFIRKNTINMEEVYHLVKAKKARLNFVYSDCCNSFVNFSRYEDSTVLLEGVGIDWKKANAEKLFIEATGSYIVSATQKGQMAAGNSSLGGFFTHSLLAELKSSVVAYPLKDCNWDYILNKSGERSAQLAQRFICEGEPCSQRMIYTTWNNCDKKIYTRQ